MIEDQRDAFERAIAFMNTGDERARSSIPEQFRTAIPAYSRAIDILTTIAKSSAESNALGAAYMNRGQLRYRLNGPSYEAESDFHRAAETLEPHLNESNPWIRRNFAGALINNANLLIDVKRADDAHLLSMRALSIIREREERNSIDLQLALLARRTLCDAIGQTLPNLGEAEQVAQATEASEYVDEALSLIRSRRTKQETEPYPEISYRLFHFGANLCARHQPHFLEGFLREHLEGLRDSSLETHFRSSARDAIRSAIDTISLAMTRHTTDLDAQDAMREQAESLLRFHQTRLLEREGIDNSGRATDINEGSRR